RNTITLSVLFLLLWYLVLGARVEQPSREMTANEADQVTLTCNYTSKTTNVYLFWYKHLSNMSPTFILNKYPFSEGTTESDFKKRFYAKLDTTSRTVPLMIKNLRVSDSAVYYCALKPTVTEAHSTLIQLCQRNAINQVKTL
uniref:Ig-like domain-containing protein n=1 Tax=Cyprinus carpio TaxID=7962 RepID=A0A8C2I7R2_CYPCA